MTSSLSPTKVTSSSRTRKDIDLANKLKDRAKNLKDEFNEKFWMEEENYFAVGLNGKQKQRKAITSNPGHCLFTGIIDEEKVKKTVHRLFQEDMWTPFGIRTHSLKEQDFDAQSYHLGSVWPHDNWIIAQGLKKYGFKKEYQQVKQALVSAHQKLGFLPEYYGVVGEEIIRISNASYPQAWATCALFNFLGFSIQEKILRIPPKIFQW